MGRIRESNPGPPAPKAGIMPLDQCDTLVFTPNVQIYDSLRRNAQQNAPNVHNFHLTIQLLQIGNQNEN